MKKVKKVWGSELWIANNELYCCKILRLKKQYICSYHKHDIKDETFYILSGMVLMKHNDRSFFMEPDSEPVRIKPGEYHSFLGIHHSEILEISTQHFDNDSYRKDESRKLSDEEYGKYYKYGKYYNGEWLWRCKKCDAVIDKVPCRACEYNSRYKSRR